MADYNAFIHDAPAIYVQTSVLVDFTLSSKTFTYDGAHKVLTALQKHAHIIYSNFFSSKIENFQWKKFDIFLIFAQNIDCGYMLEPPCRGGSNEYPQSTFWSKNRSPPAYPSFAI